MKKLLLIFFTFLSLQIFAQDQKIEFCKGEKMSFEYFAIGTPNCDYFWEVYKNDVLLTSSKLDTLRYTFSSIGDYRITAYIDNGMCESIVQEYNIEVFTCREPILIIPNSFTPNGDYLNDIIYLHASYISEVNFEIYNNWGNLIFGTRDLTIGWDGTFKGINCPTGVYFYTIEYKSIRDVRELKKGTITLYR